MNILLEASEPPLIRLVESIKGRAESEHERAQVMSVRTGAETPNVFRELN